MEFPNLGQQCALNECKQLDFLPVKCDACDQIFCAHHYTYEAHKCSKAKARDVQVPVCPICSEPVPSKRGQLPDVAVSLHIDRNCRKNDKLDPSERVPPPSNLEKCNYGRCKQKDIIYLECNECRSKFCLKHRHSLDHQCPGPKTQWQSFTGACSSSASSGTAKLRTKAQQCATSIASGASRAHSIMSRSGQEALNRLKNNSTNSNNASVNRSGTDIVESIQGTLSEQDALDIAMSNSIAEQQNQRNGSILQQASDSRRNSSRQNNCTMS